MSIEVRDAEFGGTPLTAAALAGSAPQDWFPRVFRPGANNAALWRSVIALARSEGGDWIQRLGPALSPRPGTLADERLRRIGKERGVAVTTGQQPGLFGGPLYTLSKAVSALALADEIERATSTPVVPIFWAATDDTDALEASATIIPGSTSAEVVSMELPKGSAVPMARLALPDIDSQLASFRRAGGSGAQALQAEVVERAYSRGSTVGGAYVQLLREVLEPLGICVLDSAHESVRSAGFPLLSKALDRSADVESALDIRNAAIRDGGYKPQVREVRGKSLVFHYSDEAKRRLAVGDVLPEGGDSSLSANVLLRPIMERSIIPTVAYVAGPAEIAYFAQVSAVADVLGAEQPAIAPRWSGTIIEPAVGRILSSYNLSVRDFADPHRVETVAARGEIPQAVAKAIDQLEQMVTSGLTQLSAAEGNPLSRGVIAGLRTNLLHRIERLERRAAAAMKRQGSEKLRDLGVARASLFPMGKPQERAISWAAMLARHGDEVIDGMMARAREHARALV